MMKPIGAFFLAWALLGIWPAVGSLVPETQVLAPGAVIDREVAAGETQLYTVELAAGDALHLAAEQQGADVVMVLADPEGRELLAVDSPSTRHGSETLAFDAAVAGSYRIEIRARARGRYQVTLVEPRVAVDPPLAVEPRRRAAELARTEASARHRGGTAEAWREAILRYREALSYWQSVGRRRDEAWTLHAVAILHTRLNETEPAVELLQRAAAIFREVADPDGEGDAHNMLGHLHRLRSERQLALASFRRALAIREARQDRCGQAQTLSNMGLLENLRGEPRRALELYEQTLALCDETDHPSLGASLLVNLGGAYDALGEPQEALALYARAVAPLRAAGEPVKAAATLSNMGVSHRVLGEYQQALESYSRALEVLDETDERRLRATVLNNLGYAYLNLGEPGTARTYWSQALPLRREVGDPRGESATLDNLGRAADKMGNPGLALSLYRQALAIRREIGDRGTEAVTLDHMGTVDAAQGDLATARERFGRALELRRELDNPMLEAETLRHLADVELDSGRPQQARDHLRQALEHHRRLKDRRGEILTLPVLARAERSLGDLASARGHLEAALDAAEEMRARIASPDLRASFLSLQRDTYAAAVDLLMELGFGREALELAERARARSLLEILNEAGADVHRGADPELLARRRSIQRRLNGKAEKRQRLLGKARYLPRALAMEVELEELLTALRQVETEIRRRSPAYVALRHPRPRLAGEIQQLLDPGSTLLQFSLGQERSFLWVVSPSSLTSFELPPRQKIEAAARRLHHQWSILDAGRGGVEDRDAAAAAELSEMLLGPAARQFEGIRRLVVVADGALHDVPFAALPLPGTPGTPLLVAHEIVVLPSASVLALQRQLAQPRPTIEPSADGLFSAGSSSAGLLSNGRVAVLADPIFSRHDSRITGQGSVVASPGASERTGASTVAPALLELPRLPATRHEAEAVAGLVDAGQLRTAFDSQARRELLTDGGLRGYRVLHLATHGIVDDQHPELSGLFFSRFDDTGRPLDGFLALHEIYNLELDAELVVLSGCETARGKEVGGEGLIGLTRGFLYAGATQVVASLWRIQDRATAELMRRFYRAMLHDALAPAAALRQAQLALRQEPEWQDPYYWAAFVVSGDWR